VIDLWLRQPATFMPEALAEGFRNFTWHIGVAMAKRVDPIARMRAYALPYGEKTKLMLIDYPGASEYGLFSSYDEPLAVYPTWAPDEDPALLEQLCKNPVGENPKFYNDDSVPPSIRPVKGQKHRVVIHRIPNGSAHGKNNVNMMLRVSELQAKYNVEIFTSGLIAFDFMFGYGLTAADWRPGCMIENLIYVQVELPSGKTLTGDKIFDPRYADWFELIGIDQADIFKSLQNDRRMIPQVSMRSVQWARRNWHKVEPFVLDRMSKLPPGKDFEDRILQPSSAFVLPAARRRVMRNLGLKLGELDKFACDVCILHNTCKLYRANSVCTVKGAETVGLSEAFGTRSADRIIDGLSKLLERQAERLEDALAAEDPADTSPDVTRQLNSVFSNGVKLAKLIDPSLAGGPKVTVNVGVGAGGHASVVAQQDPRQITSRVVAELEAAGIPREDITAEMLSSYLKAMVGDDATGMQKAIAAAKVTKKPAAKKIKLPEDYSPEEQLIQPGLLGLNVIEGTAEETVTTDGDQ
jgi:hypothetical protein